MSGGRRISRCRSRAGVSPLRIATVGRVRERRAEPLGRVLDPGERRAEVLLDVDGERPQRRHVEDARPRLRVLGRWLGGQPIDRPQERGERLARTGGREDQGVVAGGDRLPAVALGARGRLERGPEPIADGGREDLEGHVHNLPGVPDTREATGRMPRHACPAPPFRPASPRRDRHPRPRHPRPLARERARAGRPARRRPPIAAEDQIVLAGTVTVPQGERVGEVVVFSGERGRWTAW